MKKTEPPAPAAGFALRALSPLDGRYAAVAAPLAAHFSEAALIRLRLKTQTRWIAAVVPQVAPRLWTGKNQKALAAAEKDIDGAQTPAQVKRLEAQTRHDVKAAEYWLAERLQARGAAALRPYAHFACTSWDVNNIAFSLQVAAALQSSLLPALQGAQSRLLQLAQRHANAAMLARTHGQPASPTTVGKEFANFAARLAPRLARLRACRLPAKANGASGNYNAHCVAAPKTNWQRLSQDFVESFGLRFAPYTTQIEPYDDFAELCDLLRRINTILLDLCRDVWGYVALNYFLQKTAGAAEAGSSAMPHKINPIDFENAEGNLGVANAMLAHFGDKLPVSRWQRDLSDSTVLRSAGAAFGHCLLAWRAVAVGLDKLQINPPALQADLNAHWEVLAEAAQTVLRAEGLPDAYERLKAFSRGKAVSAEGFREFVRAQPVSPAAKARLLALTPAGYCGLAARLAKRAARGLAK